MSGAKRSCESAALYDVCDAVPLPSTVVTVAVPAEPAEETVKVVPLGVVATVHAPTIEVPAVPVTPSRAITEPTTRPCVETVVTVTVEETRTAEAIGGQSSQS
jgi:hypothetical protein